MEPYIFLCPCPPCFKCNLRQWTALEKASVFFFIKTSIMAADFGESGGNITENSQHLTTHLSFSNTTFFVLFIFHFSTLMMFLETSGGPFHFVAVSVSRHIYSHLFYLISFLFCICLFIFSLTWHNNVIISITKEKEFI